MLLLLGLLVIGLPILLIAVPFFLLPMLAGPDREPQPAETSAAWEPFTRAATTGAPAPTTGRGTDPAAIPATTSATTGTPTAPPVRINALACPDADGPLPGIAVGPRTTCAFGAATRAAYLAAGAPGQPVVLRVHSAARGDEVPLRCVGETVVRCVSADGAAVYLHSGNVRLPNG